ncbi:PREDICTED: mitochondrial import receptor subunit TOM70-like [Acropora digitifera]|uniref:mitochondrial import receptor subunit TOM70-like n=1 Tax=Acropora digitifera TaxID=70779 RepID=UPI00077A3446|nr:PREDICTED: mitochondrial import receptor subunit TOM70-like [Acropora digitifera]
MSAQESSGSLSKWQIAALIGVPVATACVVGGFYYWKTSKASSEDDVEKGETGTADDETAESKDASEENRSPAERAAAVKLRGNKYFKGGKFDLAIQCYTEAIELCPEDNKTDLATYYQNRAAAYAQQDNSEQVIEDATKEFKKYSKAFMKRARAYELLNRKEDCLRDLTAVCMIEGFNNPNWMVQADRVLKEIGKEKAQEYYKTRKPTLPSPTYIKAYLESFCHDDTLEVNLEEDSSEESSFLEAVKQMKGKEYENILDLCTQQIEKGPGPFYVRALALRGTMYTLISKVDEAIKDLTQVIDSEDEQVSIKLKVNCLIKRGSMHLQATMLKECVEDFTKAISLDPDNSDIYHHRGQNMGGLEWLFCINPYIKNGATWLCHECFCIGIFSQFLYRLFVDLTAVCMIEGFNNPNWMVQADRVLKEIGKEKAQEYYKTRKPTLPSPTYIKAYLESFCHDDTLEVNLEEDSSEESSFLEAVKQMKGKKYENILDLLDLCTQQIEKGPGPFYVRALALRGTMYTLISKVDEAIKDLTQVIDSEDEQVSIKLKVNCLIKRGSMHLQATMLKECVEDFTKAISLDPDNSDIYHHRGQINFLSEKLTEAKEDFEKCISLNDSFIPAKIQLAYSIYKSAALQQSPILAQGAVEMLQKTVEKYPDSADAHSLFAQVLQDMQQFAKAEEHFDLAIKAEPKNPVHLVYKGMLMLQWRQDVEKAADLVNEALEIDDKCDFAYETLATLEVQRGHLDKAIELFDKAIELVRTEAELAQTFSLREAAKAQKYVTEILGLTPPTVPFMS